MSEPRHQLRVKPANDFCSLHVQIKQRRSKPQELFMVKHPVSQVTYQVQG
ncbi:Unknown protein sequence [Pseudomonas amygdali pv. lachrymans]|nr:Unknown protein sequence [Pseudomonas amygdali pv. lachrymans]